MKKLCIGLLTFCNDKTMPKRYEIFKKAINSLVQITKNRNDVFVYVWDNGSSKNVKNFRLSKKDIFDKIYFSKQNLYDFAAVVKLVKIAKSLNAEYVCHLEDDFLFYEKSDNFLDNCYQFLENNLDCGYLRIVKYEYDKKEKYDKFLNHPQKDTSNCQRHFNNITKQNLKWEGPEFIGNNRFYKNNWHWYNYPNICRTSVFEKIIPDSDNGPLHQLEGYMMRKYHDLGLKVGILDKGVTTHLDQDLNKDTSVRINQGANTKKMEVISYKNILNEIKSTKSAI